MGTHLCSPDHDDEYRYVQLPSKENSYEHEEEIEEKPNQQGEEGKRRMEASSQEAKGPNSSRIRIFRKTLLEECLLVAEVLNENDRY
jgi:hypothetical protein